MTYAEQFLRNAWRRSSVAGCETFTRAHARRPGDACPEGGAGGGAHPSSGPPSGKHDGAGGLKRSGRRCQPLCDAVRAALIAAWIGFVGMGWTRPLNGGICEPGNRRKDRPKMTFAPAESQELRSKLGRSRHPAAIRLTTYECLSSHVGGSCIKPPTDR